MNELKTKKCSNCDADVDETKFFLHERMCINLIKRCECGIPIEIELMEEHIKEAHTDVNCKFCKKAFNKKKLEDHQKVCNYKPTPCKYCEMEIIRNDLIDHENICGAKTEICSICRKPIMIKELDDHSVACSIKENNRIRNEQIANEKKKEEKLKREKEEERKKIEEKTLEEQRKKIEKENKLREEKRQLDRLKFEEERKKEEKKKIEEKIKEEKKLEEKRLEEDLRKRNLKIDNKNPISNNKFQPKQNILNDINHHQSKYPSDLKELNKNYIKESIINKKDNNVSSKGKTENIPSSYQPKPAKDYINSTFKDPKAISKNEVKFDNKFEDKKLVSSKEQISSKYLPKNKGDKEVNINIQSNSRPNITASTNKNLKPSENLFHHDFYEDDSDDLIRKLQLLEDEKLAKELMNEKQVNIKSDEEFARILANSNNKDHVFDDEEMAKKLQEEYYNSTQNNFY